MNVLVEKRRFELVRMVKTSWVHRKTIQVLGKTILGLEKLFQYWRKTISVREWQFWVMNARSVMFRTWWEPVRKFQSCLGTCCHVLVTCWIFSPVYEKCQEKCQWQTVTNVNTEVTNENFWTRRTAKLFSFWASFTLIILILENC